VNISADMCLCTLIYLSSSDISRLYFHLLLNRLV